MEIINGFPAGAEVLQARRLQLQHQPEVQQVVETILSDVRNGKDAAVKEYTLTLDKVHLDQLEVPKDMWIDAFNNLPTELLTSLQLAAERVTKFHEASMPKGWMDIEQGYGELQLPIDRVGIYIPGGAAAYPSTVLMTALPARVAGVREIVLVTPPGETGDANEFVLAAAHLAGVDRVFRVGGAQAIGALAYGTETIPKVDLICGPGNVYVTMAKRLVYGIVGIDGLYGPTETVLIADCSANPASCAADLIAQAEHDPLATPIFITNCEELLATVFQQIEHQMEGLARSEIARLALDNQGISILVSSIEDAIELANLFAPEHLCLLVTDPSQYLKEVRHAGGVFLGELSPEVLGDYVAGPSHVMPTGGTARFSGPLGIHQFLKSTSVVSLTNATFEAIVDAGIELSTTEGLLGHATAMKIRRNQP